MTGGRRPRLGGREWFGRSHVRPAALLAAGGSLTVATVVLGLLNATSATRVIALAVLATLATTGGMIGLVIPDAWAAWRRGFQEGFKLGMNRQAQWRRSSYRAGRTRKPAAEGRPEPIPIDKPESIARGDASGDGENVIVSLPTRRGRSSLGRSSRHR